MKTRMMIAMLGLSLCINSCKKDKDTGTVDKNYFTIENATYVNADFPAPSSGSIPVISAVLGNYSILEGGSNPISITTSSAIKEVLIGVKGKMGYYRQGVENLKSTVSTYLTYLLFSQDFKMNNFTIIISIVGTDGLISEPEYIDVSKITAGTGKLQVSCSWNKEDDIDLHLIEPNSFEICWREGEDTSANGGILDVDSNPFCYMDYINNENITYSGNAIVENGKYIVRIVLFSACDITDLTNYVVTARLNGELITPTFGTNPYYGSVAAASAYIGGNGTGLRDGVTVMEFNVAGTKSANLATSVKQKMLQFSYPKHVNELKKSMDASLNKK